MCSEGSKQKAYNAQYQGVFFHFMILEGNFHKFKIIVDLQIQGHQNGNITLTLSGQSKFMNFQIFSYSFLTNQSCDKKVLSMYISNKRYPLPSSFVRYFPFSLANTEIIYIQCLVLHLLRLFSFIVAFKMVKVLQQIR